MSDKELENIAQRIVREAKTSKREHLAWRRKQQTDAEQLMGVEWFEEQVGNGPYRWTRAGWREKAQR